MLLFSEVLLKTHAFAKELSQLFEASMTTLALIRENLRGLGHLSLPHLRRVIKKTLGYHALHPTMKSMFIMHA